jgi:methylenetetrahydrofolate dehydrogenase (NADP+)/methenyltetrahydrofolate cyclohydrolase
MPARILGGRAVSERIQNEVQSAIAGRDPGVLPPGLAAVLVGDDPASQVYVRNKIQTCERLGIASRLVSLPGSCRHAELVAHLESLNADPQVDGILLQLPLPPHLSSHAVLERIDPGKDVDGLHPVNLGKLVTEDPSGFVPCTPAGVVELLHAHEVPVAGQHVVILGRSTLVGRPLALLLLRRDTRGNATVTVAHTRSHDVPELVRRADILVVAVGSPRYVRGEWLRPGATVVDVGIHRVGSAEPGKTRLVGDVDAESALPVAGALTPVPGGVGLLTVAMLMQNTLLAWRRHRGENG